MVFARTIDSGVSFGLTNFFISGSQVKFCTLVQRQSFDLLFLGFAHTIVSGVSFGLNNCFIIGAQQKFSSQV